MTGDFVDQNRAFELRLDTLRYYRQLQQSTVVGLMGPRIQLLPHQLYIANETASRYAPRVLLADEVGLGKTIEAGLIIHQQLVTGRANRVLIAVPDSLIHQWLVEMLRRFNLFFTILDEERCLALMESGSENPFESAQLVLCGMSFLTAHSERVLSESFKRTGRRQCCGAAVGRYKEIDRNHIRIVTRIVRIVQRNCRTTGFE